MIDDILIVDDDPATIRLLGHILRDLGSLRFATSGEDAVRLVRDSPPDLVLLDAEMPGMSGVNVFNALKAEPDLDEVPVIFVSSRGDAEFEVSLLDLGAADFIAKPVRAPLVIARVRTHLRMKRMADELRRCATTDGLTGIANRRKFDVSLEREWRRAPRHGNPLALLLIDVDHFKLYNDRYGHPQGDACLREMAQAFERSVRRTADVAARYGGEEFVVLLPQTRRDGAESMAHRILDVVDGLAIRHEASPTAAHVTVSIGIACYDGAAAWGNGDRPERHTETDLLLAADTALYAAKRAGRSQCRHFNVADIDSRLLAGGNARTARFAHGAA
jgi:diguanylate cyclase (GGDEF)-like protein